MEIPEIVSLIASIFSLVLGVLAIWLSIVFYRMSTKASDSTNKASEDIHASVEKLEQLFDKLYADTFSTLRDTVTDMRKHMWPENMPEATATEDRVQERTEKRIDELKQQMNAELSSFLAKQQNASGKVDNLAKDLLPFLDRAISESTKVTVESREDTIREAILVLLKDLATNHIYTVAADELVGRIDKKYALSFVDTVNTFRNLRSEGLIHWEGPDYILSSTFISINPEITKVPVNRK